MCDAMHFAEELSGRYRQDRKALAALSLSDSAHISCVANDYGYDLVYSRIIEGIGHKADVLIGLSTSGNSANIVKAFEVARTKEITTIGFTGFTGGVMKELCDYLLNVPSTDTPRIQESHILIGHIICQMVEEDFFSSIP